MEAISGSYRIKSLISFLGLRGLYGYFHTRSPGIQGFRPTGIVEVVWSSAMSTMASFSIWGRVQMCARSTESLELHTYNTVTLSTM